MSTDRLELGKKESEDSTVRSRTIDVDIDYKQWVTFYINDEFFAVEALLVKEVLNYDEITPVPNSLNYVTGLINLRGKVITVINTRIMFSLDSTDPDLSSNIVLIDFSEDEMVGFIVDRVDEVINLPTKSIEASPKAAKSDAKSGFVKGVAFYKNKMIICLDIKQMTAHITPEE